MSTVSTVEDLQCLFEDFWSWRLSETPEFATQIGIHDYDDRLDSYSLSAFHRRKETCEGFRKRAKALEEFIQIDKDVYNLHLFVDELNTYITGYNYKGFLFPINYLEGIQVDFERLVHWMKFENENDYYKLLKRFEALPAQVDEIILVLQEAISLGMTNHYVSMDGVLEQFDKLQVPPEESGIFVPFRKMLESLSLSVKEELKRLGKTAFNNSVLPAFHKLRHFIADEYMVHLRTEISCDSLPNGAVFYQQCLNFHLTIDLYPAQVHKTGLQEVQRIEKEMELITDKLGRRISLRDFWATLRSTRDFYCSSRQDLLQSFSDLVSNKIHPLIPKIIKTVPKMNLVVKPYPTSIPNGPAAYYLAGSHDGSRPGSFFVNLALYSVQPKYEMISLCLHEGEPGHHTQASFAMEQNRPSFRRFLEDRKYSDAPSRFPLHTAYIEGWGLYSETLGEELGLYGDLYVRFGHCAQEIFRACRLVVDTGIHALGWTQETAMSYMKEHSASSEINIANEIKRYITLPGQACAYKIGEMKLKDMRNLAQKTLGSRFDIKEFHEVILSYGGPLSLLEKQVDKFIQTARLK